MCSTPNSGSMLRSLMHRAGCDKNHKITQHGLRVQECRVVAQQKLAHHAALRHDQHQRLLAAVVTATSSAALLQKTHNSAEAHAHSDHCIRQQKPAQLALRQHTLHVAEQRHFVPTKRRNRARQIGMTRTPESPAKQPTLLKMHCANNIAASRNALFGFDLG